MTNSKSVGVAFSDPALDGAVITNSTITGGTITSPSLDSVAIAASTIENSVITNSTIGTVTPLSGAFTTVTADNGISTLEGLTAGTSVAPITQATGNTNVLYSTATNTEGDVRGLYAKVNFTGVGGSGETLRAFTTIAAQVATGGTVNGAHISLSVNAGGSVSGAGNALRCTLGAADTVTPGGTLSVIQVDSDIDAGATMPSNLSYLRMTNSNTGTIPYLMNIPTAMASAQVAASTHTVPIILADGTVLHVLCTTVAP